MYLPETKAFSLVFESAGYNSIYIMVLLGTTFVFAIILIVVLFIDFVLWLVGKKVPKVAGFRHKTTKKWLYWNLLIRILMEVYLNLVLFSWINLVKSDWSSELPAVRFCNFFALVTCIVTIVCPIVMVVHAIKNRKNWRDPSYQEKNGAIFEGLNLDMADNAWVVILIPIAHFLRRFLLCIVLIFSTELFWVQLAVQMALSTALIIIIGWARPFESQYLNRLELFSEYVTTCTLYTVMLFTDFVG